MSTVSSSTMASELLLNKIMNGQVKTDKTVTAGLRSNSASLSREALTPALESAEVKESEAYAVQFQSTLTEAVNYLNNLHKSLAGADATTALKMMEDAEAFITTIQDTAINGATPFDSTTATTLNIGNDATIALSTTPSATLASFITAAGTATDAKTAQGAITTALDALNPELARTGLQVQTIQGRSALLDDIAATFSDASSQQYAVNTSDVTNLLNNVIS